MSDPVFISRKNQIPYDVVNDSSPNIDEVIVDSVDGSATKIVEDLYYLIVLEGQSFSKIQLRVEGTGASGVSLLLSLVDTIGRPLEWKDIITFTDISVLSADRIIPFAYKWVIFDNIYVTDAQKYSISIGIYTEDV